MARSSKPFRLVASSRRGDHSVWHGEIARIGWVTKRTIRGFGIERTAWIPSTESGKELAPEPTRDAAGWAVWRARRP